MNLLAHALRNDATVIQGAYWAVRPVFNFDPLSSTRIDSYTKVRTD